MKKISVVLVLTVFLLSMVPAFAQNEDAGVSTSNVAKAPRAVSAVKSKPIATAIASKETIREMQKERINTAIEKCAEGEDEEACKERLQTRLQKVEKLTDKSITKLQAVQARITARRLEANTLSIDPDFVKYNKNLEFKARALDKIKVEKARANFLNAKQNFLNARERYQEAHLKFNEAKERVRECIDDESDECVQAREEIQTRARESLIGLADQIIEHLNKLKEKAASNEDLTEEEANEIIANLDEKISQTEELKAAIEAAETKEEIRDAAAKLKRAWATIKIRAKQHAARIVNARIGGIIVKSKQLEVKLQRILERMTENEQDTSAVEPLVEQFNAKIEEAKASYEMAQEKFREAKAQEMSETQRVSEHAQKSTISDKTDANLVEEAQRYMKAAHESLQEAQKLLRDILLSIKQAGASDELEAVSEEE